MDLFPENYKKIIRNLQTIKIKSVNAGKLTTTKERLKVHEATRKGRLQVHGIDPLCAVNHDSHEGKYRNFQQKTRYQMSLLDGGKELSRYIRYRNLNWPP